jgi:hypothetical protein
MLRDNEILQGNFYLKYVIIGEATHAIQFIL